MTDDISRDATRPGAASFDIDHTLSLEQVSERYAPLAIPARCGRCSGIAQAGTSTAKR